MCTLYSQVKGQAEIRAIIEAIIDSTGTSVVRLASRHGISISGVLIADDAFDTECTADQKVTTLKYGCDAAEGVPNATVVGKNPTLFNFACHPINPNVLVREADFVRRVE